MSFTDYHFLRNQPSHFRRRQNYANALSIAVLNGLIRAVTFNRLVLPGMIFVPMFLAILVDRVSHPTLAATYRLILLIRPSIPGPLIFVLWKWLYNFNIGPIDYFLIQTARSPRRPPPQWLGGCQADPAGHRDHGSVVGPRLPHDVLSGRTRGHTQRVVRSGAGRRRHEWRLFWHVTLPGCGRSCWCCRAQVWTAMAVIDEYLILGGFNRALPTYTWTVYQWTLRSRSATGPGLCRGRSAGSGPGDVGRGERTLLGLPFA